MYGKLMRGASLTKVVNKLSAHVLAPSVCLEMLNLLPVLDSQPGLIGCVLGEGVALRPHSLNNSIVAPLIDECDRVVVPPDCLYTCRSPDIRVDDISDILGRVGTGLREWTTFDFRKCTDFTKFNIPVSNGDSSKDSLVDQLCDRGWGNVAEATVQVHKRDSGKDMGAWEQVGTIHQGFHRLNAP